MRWLIPRLGAFSQLHPDIALHLHSAGGPLNLDTAGVDIAIRRNDFFWSHALVAEPLAEEWIGPVGLPASFASPHPPQLNTRTRPLAWQDWHRAMRNANRPAPPSQPGAPPFEHFYLSLQAAGAGLGAAIGSVYMVCDELEAGRLVAPTASFVMVRPMSPCRVRPRHPTRQARRWWNGYARNWPRQPPDGLPTLADAPPVRDAFRWIRPALRVNRRDGEDRQSATRPAKATRRAPATAPPGHSRHP